jgi:hypothetical protein
MKLFFAAGFSLFWLGSVAYQLVSGKALDRHSRVWTTRSSYPALYWTSVLWQSVVALFLVIVVAYEIFWVDK